MKSIQSDKVGSCSISANDQRKALVRPNELHQSIIKSDNLFVQRQFNSKNQTTGTNLWIVYCPNHRNCFYLFQWRQTHQAGALDKNHQWPANSVSSSCSSSVRPGGSAAIEKLSLSLWTAFRKAPRKVCRERFCLPNINKLKSGQEINSEALISELAETIDARRRSFLVSSLNVARNRSCKRNANLKIHRSLYQPRQVKKKRRIQTISKYW